MPLLTVTSSKPLDSDAKPAFAEGLADQYAEIMDSETSFLLVKHDTVAREDLWLGRADRSADIVLIEADIREGRPTEQRRTFALAAMERVRDAWDVPEQNMKVVFTEHEGTQLMGSDRVGGDWEPSSD